MPSKSLCESYRGYQIIAAGEACEIYDDNVRINRFARNYLCMDVPAELVLALLIDEAEERVDAIFNVNEGPSRPAAGRQRRDRPLTR